MSPSLGDSPDEFERMLGVLRFAFSKELKFVRQRIGKPYNSALGMQIFHIAYATSSSMSLTLDIVPCSSRRAFPLSLACTTGDIASQDE